MKVVTTNFVCCPVKGCGGFPLKYTQCALEETETGDAAADDARLFDSLLERLDWPALAAVMGNLGNEGFPRARPTDMAPAQGEELQRMLLRTQITAGEMACPLCGHVMHINNSVANFLLPPHLAN